MLHILEREGRRTVKTGHAGTLDPGASGVLPICVGKATKISSYVMGGQKEYIAEITFGKSTDTGDSYGQVTDAVSSVLPTADDVKNVLQDFHGTITQQTPAYSAAKHEGRKLYQLARAGKAIPDKKRDVHIHNIAYIAQTRDDAHLICVGCGKGTYIRTLCEDIAKKLDTIAYMSFLSRTRCAGLNSKDAYSADELIALGQDISSVILPTDMFLADMPELKADNRWRRALLNGAAVNDTGEDIDTARVYIDNVFIGIGCRKDGLLKISTLLGDEQ